VGILLRPHDLRRHAVTYASRSGTPIEIVSKVVLRHFQGIKARETAPEIHRHIEPMGIGLLTFEGS